MSPISPISICRPRGEITADIPSVRISLNACIFAHRRNADRLVISSMAKLAEIFASWKDWYIDSGDYTRRVRQLRTDRADRSARNEDGRLVHTLACAEAGRHSISALIPSLAFVLRRFISTPVVPRAPSPRWFTPLTQFLLSPFGAMCTNDWIVFREHALTTTAVWPGCRQTEAKTGIRKAQGRDNLRND